MKIDELRAESDRSAARAATSLTLTVDQAAALLGVGRDVVYRETRAGRLPSLELGRRIVIPTAKLLDLLGYPATGSD